MSLPRDHDANASDSASSETGSEHSEVAPSLSLAMKAQKVQKSFAAPARWMVIFGMILALCAGMVNVSSFLELDAVASHVTGHLTAMGLQLEGARVHYYSDPFDNRHTQSVITHRSLEDHLDNLVQSGAIVFSFIFGAFLCGLVIPHNALHFGGKSFYGVALLGNSALLFLSFGCTVAGKGLAAVGCAACACGLQNAMCTMHLGAVVRTTHCTGTATDIGSTLGRSAMILLRRRCRRRRLHVVERAELTVDFQKFSTLLSIMVSYFFGCVLGAFMFSHMGYYTLLVPAGITLTLGTLYTCFRDSIKRLHKKYRLRQLQEDMQDLSAALRSLKRRSTLSTRGSQKGPPTVGQEMHDEEEEEMEEVLERLHELNEEAAELCTPKGDEE